MTSGPARTEHPSTRGRGLGAFVSGASTAAAVCVWLRWLLLSTAATESLQSWTTVGLLTAFALGALGAGARPGDAEPPRSGRTLQLLLTLTLVAAATTLSTASPGLPFLALAAATLFGALGQILVGQLAPLTLGAAAGFLVAGFALPQWGIVATSWAACVGAAAAAWLVRLPPAMVAAAEITVPKRLQSARAAALCVTSGLGLSVWILWTDSALAPYTGDSIYAYTIFVSTILLTLGLGLGWPSGGAAEKAPRVETLWICAAIGSLLSAAAYTQLEWVIPGAVRRLGGMASWPRALALMWSETAILTLPTLLPLGAALGQLRRQTRMALPLSALGAAVLLGSWTQGIAPAPEAGWTPLLLGLMALVSLGVGRIRPRRTRIALALTALLVLGGSLFVVGQPPLTRTAFEQRYGPLLGFYREGRHRSVVTDDPAQGRILRTSSGAPVGGSGTDGEERTTTQLVLLAHPEPARVLLIGLGVGQGASSILTHDVDRLDVIDPSPVGATAAQHFEETNLEILSDPRLQLRTGDPWQLLAQSPETWDLILVAMPRLDAAKPLMLPTRERLRLVRQRLAPGGMLGLPLNVGRASRPEVRAILRTVLSVFARVTLWDGPLGFTWMIQAATGPSTALSPRLLSRLDRPELEEELSWLELESREAVAQRHVMGTDAARNLAGQGPLVTTDRPLVDGWSARSPDSFFGLGAAAADTPLADLTSSLGRENVGLARLFAKLQEWRALKEPLSTRTPTRNSPEL